MIRNLKTATKAAILRLLQKPAVLKYVHASLLHAHDNPGRAEAVFSDAARFVASIVENGGQSVSQIYQDIWVLFETNKMRGGYFVEFGALDGKTISNTYLLETGYGWKGILAEPVPKWHGKLRQNRTCHITNKCVWRASGETLVFSIVENTGYSTISEFSAADSHGKARQSAQEVTVHTVTLNDLLAEYDAPPIIDFMSIDTEGSELEILRAFDFDKYKVRLMCVEHNWTANEAELDGLLASKGFERRFPGYSQFDGWYRNKAFG